jgi:hypothetical protein
LVKEFGTFNVIVDVIYYALNRVIIRFMLKRTAGRHDHKRKFIATDLIGETFSLLIV